MTRTQPSVRPLQASDLAMLEAQFPQPNSSDHRRRLEAQQLHNYSYLCVLKDTMIAGILLIRWNGPSNAHHYKLSPYPEIGSLFILPQFRGQGLAHVLHEYAETLIKKKGIKAAGLVIKDNNLASIALHQQLGYRPIGAAQPTANDPDQPRTYYVKQLT